jgi:hypothetical protein
VTAQTCCTALKDIWENKANNPTISKQPTVAHLQRASRTVLTKSESQPAKLMSAVKNYIFEWKSS